MSDISPAWAASRDSLAMFDLSPRSQVKLQGTDRVKFLQNFCTNDIQKRPVGEGCEAFCCNAKGRVLAHVTAFLTEDAIWLDSVAGSAPALISHLDRYVIREDVSFADLTGQLSQLLFTGPRAAEFVAELLHKNGLIDWDAIVLSAGSPVHVWELDVAAASFLMLRKVDWLSHPSYQLLFSAAQRPMWRQSAIDLGAISGHLADWHALRIADGWPEYGEDITEANLPQEVARNDRCISFTKGCYLGQEPVARLDALGHTNRELRRLKFGYQVVPEVGRELHDPESKEIAGQLTSVAPDARGAGYLALGYVKTKWNSAGTRLKSGEASGEVLANPV